MRTSEARRRRRALGGARHNEAVTDEPEAPIDAPRDDAPRDDAPPSDTPPNDTPPGDAYAPPQSLAELKPWEGKAGLGDKVLLWSVLGIMAFMLATLPFRPLLLARHPILLEFVTGSLSAIGAGAAFARIGEAPLWLVIVAGIVGFVKFDWLFWLAGRRWGYKIVRLFAPNDRARAFVARAHEINPWWIRAAVLGGALPGIPAAMMYALAGLSRMRLVTFLLFDALGAALMVGLVAGLGYGLGQHAVDVVLKIDDYALWITLVLIFATAFWSSHKARRHAADRR